MTVRVRTEEVVRIRGLVTLRFGIEVTVLKILSDCQGKD